MRTRTNAISCFSLAVVCAGVLASCQKNIESKSSGSQTTKASATKMASLQSLIAADDAIQLELSVTPVTNSSNLDVPICSPTITYPDNPPGTYPYTEVRDWGTGCQNQGSGQVRSGRLITTFFVDSMSKVGSYYIQTYDNYYIDGIHIEGRAKVVHVERKSGEPQNVYHQVARNRKLTQPNGDYIIFNSSKRLVNWDDDGQEIVYLRRGYWRMTGITDGDAMESGVGYQFRDSIDVQNPLIYRYCDYVVKGKEFYDFTNQSSWEVDYGPNTCDDQADLTVDGTTTTITLPLEP